MKAAQRVDVRQPHGGEWVRVNLAPEARLEALLVIDDGETYMVAENMVEKLRQIAPGKITKQVLFTAQNRDGETFLWPVPSPVEPDHPVFTAMLEWVCAPTMH